MAKNNVNEQHDETTDTPAFVYHPTKFTEYYVKRHNLKLLPNGTFAEYRKAHVLRTMWLDYMTIAVPKRYFTKTDLADALTLFCDTHRELAVIELRTQLKCEFEDLAPLKSWLKAVTGKEDKLDVAVWAHALCNLKRKLWNLETYWEMMPVLVGKQGSGKSRAIMKLLSPIDHVTLNYEVTQATDPTIAVNFSTHYACFFDELSKGTSTNIEAIKRLISAVRINARLMYENEAGSFDQRCTFFGASNKSVGEVFRDETGARRFHDTQSADMTDRNVINSLNYISLLQGID
jgi:predicted P-loop ATPase